MALHLLRRHRTSRPSPMSPAKMEGRTSYVSRRECRGAIAMIPAFSLTSPIDLLPASAYPSIDHKNITPEPAQVVPSIIEAVRPHSPSWTPRPPSCRPMPLRIGGQQSLVWLRSACCFQPPWWACGCGLERSSSTRLAGMIMPVLLAWYAITGLPHSPRHADGPRLLPMPAPSPSRT